MRQAKTITADEMQQILDPYDPSYYAYGWRVPITPDMDLKDLTKPPKGYVITFMDQDRYSWEVLVKHVRDTDPQPETKDTPDCSGYGMTVTNGRLELSDGIATPLYTVKPSHTLTWSRKTIEEHKQAFARGSYEILEDYEWDE